MLGVLGPAHSALGEAVGALHTPLDVGILGAGVVGPGPHVVQAGGHQAVLVMIGVLGDAVGVLELGARVGAADAGDALGIAEQVAEDVHMVDAHA